MFKASLLFTLAGTTLISAAAVADPRDLLTSGPDHSQRTFTGADKIHNSPGLGAAYRQSPESNWHAMPGIEIGDEESQWITSEGLAADAIELINTIGAIADEGLDPAAYFYEQLIRIHDTAPKKLDSTTVSRLFDKVFLKLTNDLSRGIVDPTQTQVHWYRPAIGISAESLLEKWKSGSMSLREAIDKSRPQHRMYQAQVNMLKALRKQSLREQVFVAEGDTIEEGVNSERTMTLKLALLELGDLPPHASLDEQFDEDLGTAISSFQERHGLEPDGKAGPLTLKAVNTPVADRINLVALNLERWRWMPNMLEETYILVNIPDYKLHMTIGNTDAFKMDVVVGKPKNPTPVFSESMSHMVFAPTWTVPSSITNKELIPLEKQKPGYLARQNIDVFKWTGKKLQRVSHSVLTEEVMNKKKLPYVLRQSSGSHNVLGKVKFMMPNKHSIYLHDTQAKGLFSKTKRAFSHGCIRLADPNLMAGVLLQMNGVDQQKVDQYMSLNKTQQVDLDQKVPVHMAYMTAWQDKQGRHHFREDIYSQDVRLTKALAAKSRDDVILANKEVIKIEVASDIADSRSITYQRY